MLLQSRFEGPRHPLPARPTPTLMFCPQCGFDRPDDRTQCPECGRPLISKAEQFNANPPRPCKGLDPT